MKCSIHNIPLILLLPRLLRWGHLETKGGFITQEREVGWQTEGQREEERRQVDALQALRLVLDVQLK